MYSVIDIESNGAGFRKESIIEIAIFKYDGHDIVDQFISLVNPESEITPFVQKLTKISHKMVKTAPKFHEIAKRIIEITQDTTLVGHNIEFDYRMLRQEFKRLGYDFKINTIDTIPLAKKLIPDAESYSLGKLVKSLGIPLVDHHRASGDARATLELFKLLIIKDENAEIIQKHHKENNAKTYINKVRDLTQDLPTEKGIIYFQNEKGKIIFSDYTDDLSKFSKRIFNSKSKNWESLQNEVEKIYYELVGNDILAKLMMKSKGLQKKSSLYFGLYYKNGKYFADKISNHKSEKTLLKFKSFTQGLKVANYLQSKNEFLDIKDFEKIINLENRNEIWVSAGRILGEKSFLILESGKPVSYGFYELHTQLLSKDKIDKLKINIKPPIIDLQNDLKLSLLKNEFDILPLPEK